VPKYQLKDNISLTEVEEEIVLLNLSTGSYFGLNHIGAMLIKAVKEQSPIAETVKQIAEQYQMDLQVVGTDIDELLLDLVDKQLLVEC